MNKKTFKNLCLNYNKPLDKDLFEFWDYNLRCYDDEEIDKAVCLISASDKYFPSFNRLLEVVKNVVSKEVYSKEYTRDFGEIENEPIDEECKKEFEEFNEFIKEFRGE